MYVILAYDVNAKRVGKVKRICSRYLVWVQNSVFEGNITDAKLSRLKKELSKVIDAEKDGIRIYRLSNLKYSSMEVIGNTVNNSFII